MTLMLSVTDDQPSGNPTSRGMTGSFVESITGGETVIAESAYLLTVNPILSGPAWTAEGDQAEAYFGRSLASAGDVNRDGYDDVIVGAGRNYHAPGQPDEGRVFVYRGSATGLALLANWTAESDQDFARFGVSVATAGDVNGDGYSDVIVGAFNFVNVQPGEGRVYVYHGSATGLSLVANWTADSGQDFAWLGVAVASAGDVNGDGYDDVIAAAPFYSNGQAGEGRVFVYHGSATGLSLVATWTAEGDQAIARFGSSVASAGDVNGDGFDDVIVGARLYDAGQTDEGAAFVYHGSAAGLSPVANWTAEGDQFEAYFGDSVSSAGDVNGDGFDDVIAGAWLYDNGETDEGRAFVYHGSAAGLSLTASWTAESDQAVALFGQSVATAVDVNGDGYDDVIIGADSYDNGQTNEGRAYVYHGLGDRTPREGDNWTRMNPATAPSARAVYTLAYDSESDRVILFSGGTGSGGKPPDTWAYDFNTDDWTQRNPATRPPGRNWHSMAYDSGSDRVVLIGGHSAGSSTWAYDHNNDTWSNRNPSVSAPRLLEIHDMAYDAESDRIILYGGVNDALAPNLATWAYDFDNNTWASMNPPTRPPSYNGKLAYDTESDRVVFYGVSSWFSSPQPETWAYDYNSNSWTNMTPSVQPSPRSGHDMVYDSRADRILLFGGHNLSGGAFSFVQDDETWVYDFNNNTWTKLDPATKPASRAVHGMAYDSESHRTILFGGGLPGSEDHANDTWAYASGLTLDREVRSPGTPQNLRALAGDARVELTWDPPDTDGDSPIVAYRIYRAEEAGGSSLLLEVGAITEYVDRNVTNDVTYTYQVSAVNVAGEGERTAGVSATPAPPPDRTLPVIVISNPSNGEILNAISVEVSGTAFDSVALEKVECSPNGASWVQAEGTTFWSVRVNLVDGVNTIYARATDSSGNVAVTNITVTVAIGPSLLEQIPGGVWTLGVGAGLAVLAASAVILRRVRGGKIRG